MPASIRHYGCGGVKAVLDDLKIGLVDNWLANLQPVKNKFSTHLFEIEDERARFNKLCEINVIEQVLRLHNKWMDSDAFTW